jgi:aarF domain-containing kinase
MTTKNVAIKVLHPNTRLLVERDLALMQNVADFIDTCIPLEMIKMLSLPRAVANFSDIMRRQVDLRIEGDNLRTFRSNFCCSDSYKTHIDFPQPQDGFISELVLVEDHIDAKPVSFYLADDSQQGLLVRKQLAGPLLRAFLKMVFIGKYCSLFVSTMALVFQLYTFAFVS